ncbi:MAG: helix-turn-helix domain-containing protein [Candidatus Brocadiia bacterium]
MRKNSSKVNSSVFDRRPRWMVALRLAREGAGMTMQHAATELEMSISALCRIERGSRGLETGLFERMCSLYVVTPWSTIRGVPEKGEYRPPDDDPGRRLRFCRRTKGVSIHSLAGKLHVAESTISLIETGKRRLTVRFADRALEALGVGCECFFTGSGGLMLVERHVSGSAAAGPPLPRWSYAPDSSVADTALLPASKADNTIAFEIEGDSMFPYYLPGDVVFARTDLVPSPGDTSVIRMRDGSVVCKVFKPDPQGDIVLESLNKKYEPLFVHPDEIAFAWPVLGSYRRERKQRR